MENIFENAYFGKEYKTRDGRKAVYHYCIKGKPNDHYLIVDKNHALLGGYDDNGIIGVCGYKNPNLDIVSEWKGEIDEEKLDELANAHKEEMKKFGWGVNLAEEELIKQLFKAGYRKAMKK